LGRAKGLECKGFFVDDFRGDGPPKHWEFDEGDEFAAWQGLTKAEWVEMMQDLEIASVLFSSLNRRELVCNGPTSRAPRLFESVGDYITPEKVATTAKPGDMLLVKGLKADGKSWREVVWQESTSGYEPGTSFQLVFKECRALAMKLGLRLGLCYGEKPAYGGSTLGTHAYMDPDIWGAL